MNKTELTAAVNTRRTFAIISHPDAGKPPLRNKCYCLVALFVRPERLKPVKVGTLPSLTGWKLKEAGNLSNEFRDAIRLRWQTDQHLGHART